MYQIPIDELNYHINIFTDRETEWVDSVYSETLAKYPDLCEYVTATLSPMNLTSEGIRLFMRQVITAFCYTVNRDFPVNTREQLCKTLKKWTYQFLPLLVTNNQVCRASHCVQYEPMVIATIYFSNYLNGANVHSLITNSESGTFEDYFIWECINFARAIRSSALLFTVGDDVHGVCNFRGSLEIVSKIILAERFADEYVLFKDFNANLQYKKLNNTALPKEMVQYLDKCPEYKGNQENFLAYGWARDSKGNRILTMNALVQAAFPGNTDIIRWVHISSEFIHEDYVAVSYNYIQIRKEILKSYFIFCRMLANEVKNLFTKAERKQNGLSNVIALFSEIAKMYSRYL